MPNVAGLKLSWTPAPGLRFEDDPRESWVDWFRLINVCELRIDREGGGESYGRAKGREEDVYVL